MNNQNNDQEPIAEKIQNNYPQLTLHSLSKSTEVSSNDCATKPLSGISAKVPVPVTTAATVPANKTTIPSIKKSTSPGCDRKVPPYVNALPQDPVRVAKAPVQRPFVKAAPKVTTEKITVTAESSVTSIPVPKPSASGDVKRIQNNPPVRANILLTTVKPNDKAVVTSTTNSAEESKPSSGSESEPKSTEKATPAVPNRSVQLQCRTTDVFEKNIQSNVLTVTRNPMPKSPATIKIIPAKDTKTMESNVVVSMPKPLTTTVAPSTLKTTPPKQAIVSTESLCKNFPKAVSIQNIDSPKTVARFSTSNISSKTETSNSKPPSTDANLKTVAKLVIVTSADTSVRTTSPSVSVSSSSKVQTYESSAVTSSPSTKGGKSNQSSSNLQLTSLSEVETNQDILNAINSGSTACVGENVTISSAPVELLLICPSARTTVDAKIRNVSSETTIETITMQLNNPGSPAQKNKNGISAESVGKSSKQDSTPNSSASSPGEARTPKRDEIPGLSDEGKSSSSSMTLNKKVDEPVECLTISSDEETEPEQFVSSDNSDISISLLNKEPPIERDNVVYNEQFDCNVREKEIDTMLETTTGEGFTNLICRTVRIGSYKIKPRSGVTVSKYGLKIVVPPLNNSNDSVAVKIPIHDIAKVLVHYNRTLPVIFYYISPQAGAKIRQVLKMNDSSSYYFNPNSHDESHRRITLLPEKFTEDDKEDIQNYYLGRDVLEELNYTEANQLLVRSVPKDIQKTVRLPPKPVQTIMVYPPPPARGGISINTEDYSCLAEDTYLNDVIIDFYLKYLYQEKLSEEDKQKTHIFSSFFYKRLTDKATPVPRMLQNSKPTDVTVTPAEIRHDRVKKWTKNIDIFSKDYIVIPLNENQHWFLAIICFPGLTGPVRFSDNSPIDVDSSKKTEDEKTENSNASVAEADSSQTRRIGSTTITPISRNSYTLNDDDGEMEDRDEASGADEDVDEFLSSEEDTDEPYSDTELAELGDHEVMPKKKPDREPIKQPCILIFDSLKSASRARIIATLREYLHVEYKTKHNGEERDFSKNVVKGACPRVPQQTNYTDCGLYVLQYVETFFDNKITDFHIPIKTLGRWFLAETVSIKRYHIQQLLLKLMEEQKINVHALHLPELNLSPRYYESDDDDDDDDDLDGYEEGYYDEEDDDDDGDRYGHLVSYEEEVDEHELHEGRIRRFMNEDEYIEEEEEGGESRFAVFDESSSNEELSDDDDAYKDLEEFDAGERMPNRQRRTLISVTRGGDGPDDEEILHEEEEEYDEDVEVDEGEHRINKLNSENLTISRMPAGSGVITGVGVGVVKSLSQGSETSSKSSSTLEELISARPWKKPNEVSIERATEEDCPNKKFKSN